MMSWFKKMWAKVKSFFSGGRGGGRGGGGRFDGDLYLYLPPSTDCHSHSGFDGGSCGGDGGSCGGCD